MPDGCDAVCSLFSLACAEWEAGAVAGCPKDCDEKFKGSYAVRDGAPISCRLDQVLLALAAPPSKRKDPCHKAASHECPKCE